MIYSVFQNPAPIDSFHVNKLFRIEKRSWYLLIMMDLVPSLPRSARVRIRRSRLATYHQQITFAFVIIIIEVIEKIMVTNKYGSGLSDIPDFGRARIIINPVESNSCFVVLQI